MQQIFNTFDLLVPPEKPEKSDPFQRHIFKLKQDTWDYRFNNLKTYRKPTIQELEEFFSQQPYDFSTIFHSFKLKYRALTTEPSIIEKTMSPYQLYGTHNEIAHNHNITNDDSAIYFACATSPITNSLTDVAETGYLKPTQAQLDWLETYKEQMSPTQREMLDIE